VIFDARVSELMQSLVYETPCILSAVEQAASATDPGSQYIVT